MDLPEAPWDLSRLRLVCIGSVGTDAEAAAAIAAVARGAGVAITVALPAGQRHRLLQDLERTRAEFAPHQPPPTTLPADQQALLDALADGSTVTAAASALHVSRRTANRLLAEARSALGVSTNAEAVAAWSGRR